MEQTPSSTATSSAVATLHFTLATAGHVDHGKTSLLRALTGIDPDRLKEEKERQMTTDLGFAHLRVGIDELKNDGKFDRFKELAEGIAASSRADYKVGDGSELVVGFVDVPGHGKFLKNMLAGVGAIDMALVVVAADEGPMPQTIQHVKIISLLGVRKCILVLNKVDLADEETQAVALAEAQELLEHFGVEVLDSVKTAVGSGIAGSGGVAGTGVVGVAGTGAAGSEGTAGNGIDALRSAIVKQVLALPSRERILDAGGVELPSFLPVDRVFSKTGYGVVVTGTLVKGVMKVGDNVTVQPGDIGARVRGLETFGRRLERALPGQRLAVNMSLKENKPIERGHAVVGGDTKSTNTLIVQLTDLGGIEFVRSKERAGDGITPSAVRVYHGTAERVATLRWIDEVAPGEFRHEGSSNDQSTAGADGEPVRIGSGTGGVDGGPVRIGQLHLSEPVVAKPGERYIVRYGDYGIAGGEILISARPRWLTRPLLGKLSALILGGALDEAAVLFINSAPHKSVSASSLVDLVPDMELAPLLSRLVADHKVVRLGDQLITEEEKKQIEDGITAAVSEKQSETDEPGFSQEGVRVKIAPLLDRTVFQHIVKEMVGRQALDKSGERIALPGKAAAGKSGELHEAGSKVMEVLSQHLCLEISELSKSTGYGDKEIKGILNQLAKDGKAVVVNYEYASTADAIKTAHQALARVWQRQKNISPGDFREELGTSRKYVMALLAHFDDTQVTRRLQSGRVLLKGP